MFGASQLGLASRGPSSGSSRGPRTVFSFQGWGVVYHGCMMAVLDDQEMMGYDEL